jgi:hypothetical protein
MKIKYINSINFLYLLMGLVIGLIYGYITNKKQIIIKYDKLEGKVVYEDRDENNKKNYKYVAEEIKCPNSNDIINHPITYG